jgi:polyhydroxyalkanoate synthase subunit PhaC
MTDERDHPQETQDEGIPSPWRMWVDHPWTQAWVKWQNWLWAANPMSQLVPLDFNEIWTSLVHLGDDLSARPELLQERTGELLQQQQALLLWALQRGMGENLDEVARPDQKDRRFQDPAWVNNLFFSALKQYYLILSTWFIAAAQKMTGLDPRTYRRANFYIRQFADALCPANFWLTNPEVLRETLDSGGENLRRGMQNMLDDLRRGAIKVAGKDQFKIGGDLAVTPGQVILRNDLIELIQYTPFTEEVYAVPLLFIPPWINKYYVLDIRPGRSMVEYLLQGGFSVFVISWRNPDASLEHLTMEDYLQMGVLQSLEAVKSISGSERLHLVGYCLGGTLLSIALAYLASARDSTARSATFFASLQDFTEVGETAIFITEEYVAEIEKRMESKGYLDALEMASVFNLMRSNDLIWSFVVNNYLLGREPMPFDLMYWSVDGTRMPRAMHSYYLRNMYLENNLVRPGVLTMLGQPIDLSQVRTPCYVVGGLGDHIVPWRSAHRARALFSSKTRLVLGYGGHITSIINPPAKNKGFFYTSSSETSNADEWLNTATKNQGSWWPDWVRWLRRYSGKKIPAPPVGNDRYSPIVPAPGIYVLED